jgi:hypothetical protein
MLPKCRHLCYFGVTISVTIDSFNYLAETKPPRMKKYLLILLLFPLIVFSQNESGNILIVKDTVLKIYPAAHPKIGSYMLGVKFSNGQLLAGGMRVRLLKGSLPNGDFNFIATPSNTMEAKLKAKTKLKEMTIKNVLKKGNKKYGYKYVFQAAEGRYLVQAENALSSGEIEIIDSL